MDLNIGFYRCINIEDTLEQTQPHMVYSLQIVSILFFIGKFCITTQEYKIQPSNFFRVAFSELFYSHPTLSPKSGECLKRGNDYNSFVLWKNYNRNTETCRKARVHHINEKKDLLIGETKYGKTNHYRWQVYQLVKRCGGKQHLPLEWTCFVYYKIAAAWKLYVGCPRTLALQLLMGNQRPKPMNRV